MKPAFRVPAEEVALTTPLVIKVPTLRLPVEVSVAEPEEFERFPTVSAPPVVVTERLRPPKLPMVMSLEPLIVAVPEAADVERVPKARAPVPAKVTEPVEAERLIVGVGLRTVGVTSTRAVLEAMEMLPDPEAVTLKPATVSVTILELPKLIPPEVSETLVAPAYGSVRLAKLTLPRVTAPAAAAEEAEPVVIVTALAETALPWVTAPFAAMPVVLTVRLPATEVVEPEEASIVTVGAAT